MSSGTADSSTRTSGFVEGLAESTLTTGHRGFSFSRVVCGIIGVAVALAIWQALAYVKADPVVLPTVHETARTFVEYMGKRYPGVLGQTLWQHALVSLARIIVGWTAGVIVGITVGALMVSVPLLRYLFDPLIEMIRPLPALAFIPLFIVWFGIGETSKVLLVFVGVIPIMIIATIAALDAVPEELVHAGRSLGGSPAWVLLTVRLRSALPSIITGMRLAMGGAWTSIVAVELIAATSGLGYVINSAGVNLQTPLVLSGVVMISILGLLLDCLLRLFQRAIDPTRR